MSGTGVEYIRVEYEYDSNGNQIKEIYYDSDGSISGITRNEYDSNGNQIKGFFYDSDGNARGKFEHEYDSNGNVIKYIEYNADGSVRTKEEYNWNSDGSVCTSSGIGGSATWTREDRYITINSKKLIKSEKEEIFWDGGIMDYSGLMAEYEYDSKGNMTKRTNFDIKNGNYVKDSEITYTYTYITI